MLRTLTNHVFTLEGRLTGILETYEKRLVELGEAVNKAEGQARFCYAICVKPEIKKLAGFVERGAQRKW